MSNKSVLVVEDNHLTAKLLREALESEGFEVTVCHNGRSAVGALGQGCFQTILTDYRMERTNGVELTRQLRSMCPESIIIGLSIEGCAQDFLSAGANAFMYKPIIINDLVALINQGA